MYEASKSKHKPKQTNKLKFKELLSIDDGGLSYWSDKKHTDGFKEDLTKIKKFYTSK